MQEKKSKSADEISIFICGAKTKTGECSSPGCNVPTHITCSFALGGKLAGKTCGRSVCETHSFLMMRRVTGASEKSKVIAYCAPHYELARNLLAEKRAEALAREQADASKASKLSFIDYGKADEFLADSVTSQPFETLNTDEP